MFSTMLAGLMACAAITIATIVGWTTAALAVRCVRLCEWPARSRATLLTQLRLLPLAAVVALVTSQVWAFRRFEVGRTESAGPLLIVLALLGGALVIDALIRGLRVWRRTRAVAARWQSQATPIVLPNWDGRAWLIGPAFPIVAVVGAFRPQLFVARQVMEHCSPEEVAAIAAHEAAHVRSRDNLTRLLFALTPGARLFSRSAAALEDAWVRATEEAADVLATQRAGPLALASALTRVARLAPADASRAVVASTLISVSDLEIRVRRLLQPPASARQQRARWLPATLLVLAALSAHSPRVARTLHELFELLVRPY